MADAITIKALQDASLDAKSLEEVVNGNEVKQVTTRKGETYPSVKKAINTMFENGGLPATPFETKAQMEIDGAALADGHYAMVTDDTANNGLYVKTAGAWVKSDYDPVAQANAYTDTAKSEAINTAATYTDEKIDEIDLATPVLTGQAIYDKAITTNEKFTAIWSEYNKPVWHIGDSVFVDAVGATVKVVEQEFVMTYKLTEENQTVRVPLVSKDASTAYVDWGDGTANYIDTYKNMHTYTNAIGDEFVITITGELEIFSIGAPTTSNRTADCIKSIDKNTMPKTTASFSFRNFPNLVSLCDGAFSSLAGDSLNLELYQNVPKTVTYGNNLFAGLQNVKNIDNLFTLSSATDITGITYSPELFKYFTSVTSAKRLFDTYKGNLTKEHLEAMTELQYANYLLARADGVVSPNILENQKKLIDVSQCFYRNQSTTISALPIYQHLLNNNPNITNYVECFKYASLQDVESIPAEWK